MGEIKGMTVGMLISKLKNFQEDLLVVDLSCDLIEDVKIDDVYLCDQANPHAETTRVVRLI